MPIDTPNANAPRFNAMQATPEQIRQRLAAAGVVLDGDLTIAHREEPRPTAAQRQQQRILDRDARQHARTTAAAEPARAAAITAGRIDARSASGDAVSARMKQLGIAHNRTDIIEPTRPQPARAHAPDPTTGAGLIEREARALLARAKRGERIDVRTISDPQVAQRYMDLRFAGGPGQWG